MLRRALGYLAPHRGRVALAAGLQFATVTTGIALMATAAWLISRAALRPSIAALSVAIVGVRAFGISRGVLRYTERLVSHDVTLRLLATLRVRIYAALEGLSPVRLSGWRGGDLLGRLVADVGTLDHMYVRVVGPTVAAALVAIAIAAVLAPHAAGVAAIALAGLAGAGVAAPWLAWRLGHRAGTAVVGARADLQAAVVDGIRGLPELVAFDRTSAHADRVGELGTSLGALQQRAARASALGGALGSCIADVSVAAAVAVAVHATRAGDLDGVHIAVVALAVLAAFEAVWALPAAYQALAETRQAAARLFEVIDAPPAVAVPEAPVATPAGRLLEIAGLSFRYPGSRRDALREVSASVSRGRVVAIVGPSGAGKSTLVQLLLRFLDAPAGSLLMDGIDVRAMAPDAVRERLAVVTQRTDLFTGTIDENLRLGHPAATDPDLAAATSLALLQDTIAALPAGYQTWIGEQGHQLSGGERQRVALARALLKPAPFLLLDEPTANVDPVTERAMLDAIRAIARDRGVLLVTHRLAGLDVADEIVVLAAGRIVERGGYRDLAAGDGWFGRMLALQKSDIDALGSQAPRSDQ